MAQPEITGYSEQDIENTIKRVIEETQETRDKALSMYDTLLATIEKANNNSNAVAMLAPVANFYLAEATKQTEQLVKLAAVMQKLKATKVMEKGMGQSDGLGNFDFRGALEELDKRKILPTLIEKNDGIIPQIPDERIIYKNMLKNKEEKSE